MAKTPIVDKFSIQGKDIATWERELRQAADMSKSALSEMMLKGFGLTTAEILYRLPDHPSLLQSFVWQDYDLQPRFPRLQGFLGFWETNLEGKLHKVRVAHSQLVKPAELTVQGSGFKLN